MTISSTSRIAGPYVGDGTTANFPFTFKVFDKSDLLVVTLNLSSGSLTELVLDSDYTAVLNLDQDTTPGGTITLTAGNLASGLTLTITTDLPQLQELNLTNGGGFYPDVMNSSLDTLVILLQQLMLLAVRSIRIPLPETMSMELPAAALRASKTLGFDAAGNLQLVTFAGGGGGGGAIPQGQISPGTVDGSNNQFPFTAPAGATPAALVFAGGVFQNQGVDYSGPTYVSGSTWKVNFTSGSIPTQGSVVVVLFT